MMFTALLYSLIGFAAALVLFAAWAVWASSPRRNGGAR